MKLGVYVDIGRLVLYIHVLGICVSIAASYIIIIKIILGVEIQVVSIVILFISWIATIFYNPIFHQLIHKWFKN
jgi:hypothetical protein